MRNSSSSRMPVTRPAIVAAWPRDSAPIGEVLASRASAGGVDGADAGVSNRTVAPPGSRMERAINSGLERPKVFSSTTTPST
jgi:hypothetical protein